MAKVHEELAADVRFGGTIDPSWTTSITGLKRSMEALSKESSDLVKQQSKLKTKRLEAAMRGDVEQVKKLNEEHAALGRRIKDTIVQEERLSKVYKRREQMDRFKGRAGSIGKAIGRGAGRGALWAGVAGTGGIATLGAGIVAINAEMNEQIGLARSYSMDTRNFLAADKLARQAGLNGENVGDLHEEYKNKFGDYIDAGMKKGALYEVATDLGLKKGELKGMDNEEQVTYFLDRLATMKDDQKAAQNADKLFGGEGNKLVTFLRKMGWTYSEAIAQEKEYIMVSQKGLVEAEKGQYAMRDLWTVVQTAAMEVSGMTLGAFSKNIRGATDDLSAWFKNGGLEKITSFITEKLIPGIALLARVIFTVSKAIYSVATKYLSWVMDDEEEIASNKQDILRQVAAGNSVVAEGMAKDLDLTDWYQSKVNNEGTKSQLRSAWQQGGTSEEREARIRGVVKEDETIEQQIAKIEDAAKNMFSQPIASESGPAFNPNDLRTASRIEGEKRVNNDVKTTINVYQQPGEDGNALAERTAKEIMRPFQSGMYDPAEVM